MNPTLLLGILFISTSFVSNVLAWGLAPILTRDHDKLTLGRMNRSSFFIHGILASSLTVLLPSPGSAVNPPKGKLMNLSNEELYKIIRSDVVDKSFLATADLTREIYDEGASFTDEMDTYSLEKWITGTKKLFNGEKSRVRLVGDVEVTPQEAKFRFDEDLMFRIPFNPVVTLTGLVVLKRDVNTGLITSYREYWDQDVATVLKSAKFF